MKRKSKPAIPDKLWDPNHPKTLALRPCFILVDGETMRVPLSAVKKGMHFRLNRADPSDTVISESGSWFTAAGDAYCADNGRWTVEVHVREAVVV